MVNYGGLNLTLIIYTCSSLLDMNFTTTYSAYYYLYIYFKLKSEGGKRLFLDKKTEESSKEMP